MADVIFQMCVFNGDYVLEPVLQTLRPFGRVLVCEGPVGYWQERGFKTSTDATNEILHAMLPASDIVHGQFAEKDEMMRSVEHLIPPGTSHVWMVDSDEVYPAPLVEQILRDVDELDSVEFKPHTFFGGFERVLTGFELRAKWQRIQRWHKGATWHSHRPPTVLAPDGQPYHTKRHVVFEQDKFFHYSYVFPSQVKNKVDYYASWGAGVIPNYFERVYRPWVLGSAKTQADIENEFDGVHEWLPARRGDARTRAFDGSHPRKMEYALPHLKRRLAHEIAEMQHARMVQDIAARE